MYYPITRGFFSFFFQTDFENKLTKQTKPPNLLVKNKPTELTDNHKELMEKIQKDKEDFLEKKKKQEEEKKKEELEKLISSTKNTSGLDRGLSGGEPADPITKQRRIFIKKVGK